MDYSPLRLFLSVAVDVSLHLRHVIVYSGVRTAQWPRMHVASDKPSVPQGCHGAPCQIDIMARYATR